MREDRRAFSDEIAQACDVIEVTVGDNHIANRLSRNRLLGLSDHGSCPRLVLHAIDDNGIIVECHRYGLIGAIQYEHARRRLDWGRRSRRSWSRATRATATAAASAGNLRRRGACRGIGNNLIYRQLEDPQAALLMKYPSGKSESFEVAIAAELGFHQHVPEYRVVEPCFDLFQDIVGGEVSPHPISLVSTGYRKGDHVQTAPCNCLRLRGRIVVSREANETIRREPDLKLLRPWRAGSDRRLLRP